MSDSDATVGPIDDDARVQAAIARVVGELEGLPLTNENKKRRLELNQQKLTLEAEREALIRQREIAAQTTRMETLRRELAALGDTPAERLRQGELRRALGEVRAALALLLRQG